MACKHPLKAFEVGVTENGKRKLKICSYQTDHVELCNGEWQASSVETMSSRATSIVRDFVTIPCGKCVGCRLEYSRQWANRLMLELKYHTDAWFVTLTYDDLHVPKSYYCNPDTGEAFESLTLCKRDFQLFMKSLRKEFPDRQLRYYAAGEYGDHTMRPHFHVIIYDLPLDDLVYYKRSPQGFTYFISKKIEDVWKRGQCCVAPVTWETCAYTARYVMKKVNGQKADMYEFFNIEPECCLMSRKPGIARQYFDDHPDILKYDSISISTEKGGMQFKPPKYYSRLFDLVDSEESQRIKDISKEMAAAIQEQKLEKTQLSFLEMLAVEEQNLIKKTSTLERRL